MGGEFGQPEEWNHDTSLDWLLDMSRIGLMRWVSDSITYRQEKVHRNDCSSQGFEWVDCDNADESVISWQRGPDTGEAVLVVFNYTPVARHQYRVGCSMEALAGVPQQRFITLRRSGVETWGPFTQVTKGGLAIQQPFTLSGSIGCSIPQICPQP